MAHFITWLSLWIATTYAMSQSPITLTKLPDGISITGGQPLHQITATWAVYVTLDPPPYPTALAYQVAALDHTFDDLMSASQGSIPLDIHAQQIRAERLKQIMGIQTQGKRYKRGLIDLGGNILNALFGVATTAQLKRFEHAVVEIGSQQDIIAHAHNNLASIVNQTRIYVHQLAVQQHELQSHVIAINTAIRELSGAVNRQLQQINRLELLTELDRYLDVLDLAADAYMSQVSLFHRQRSELDLGQLSRDLLSPDQLSEILQQAASKFNTITELQWYYQFLKVTPLWQPVGGLLYRLELPLIDPTQFLLYNIITHPVPLANASYSIEINVEPVIALSTQSEHLMVPKKCYGVDPVACQSATSYGLSMKRCERGLITHRPQLMQYCTVDVRHKQPNTIIKSVNINEYLIATRGEMLVTRCPGLTEQHRQLNIGSYNLSCELPCSVSGEGWKINCVNQMSVEKTYKFPVVKITDNFHFTRNVPAERIQLNLPQLLPPNAPPALDIPVTSLLTTRSDRSQLTASTSHVMTFVNLTIIIIMVMIASFAILKARFIFNKIRQANKGTPQLAPIQSTLEQAATTQPIKSFWPSLPPLSECMANNRTPVDQV